MVVDDEDIADRVDSHHFRKRKSRIWRGPIDVPGRAAARKGRDDSCGRHFPKNIVGAVRCVHIVGRVDGDAVWARRAEFCGRTDAVCKARRRAPRNNGHSACRRDLANAGARDVGSNDVARREDGDARKSCHAVVARRDNARRRHNADVATIRRRACSIRLTDGEVAIGESRNASHCVERCSCTDAISCSVGARRPSN